MKQKIFVLYTGGTIGMTQSSEGLRPDTALVGQALAPFSNGMDFDWHVCGPLIDSSAVQLQNWCAWLDIIAAALPQYDGVLVLHGTDTLAYTANLFALALQGLDKPIVLTGSQWPYNAVGSDAPRNLATAVAAFPLGLKQTLIAFDGKLYPAVGSSKVSTETAAGFDNPHFGALAEWDEAQCPHPESGRGRCFRRPQNPLSRPAGENRRPHAYPWLCRPRTCGRTRTAFRPSPYPAKLRTRQHPRRRRLYPRCPRLHAARKIVAQHQPSPTRQNRRRLRARQCVPQLGHHQRRQMQPRNRHRTHDPRRIARLG